MSWRPGLTLRIFLAFVLFAAGLLVVLGLLANHRARESLKAAALSELLSTAIVKEDQIKAWSLIQTEDVQTIAASPALRQAVQALIAAEPGSSAQTASRARVVGELAAQHAVRPERRHLLGVLDAVDGRVIAATMPQVEGTFLGGRLYLQRGREGTFVQPPYQSQVLKEPSTAIATPVLGADGTTVAVLVSWLGLNELNSIVRNHSGLHRTDESFLVGTDRRFVTQPRLANRNVVLEGRNDTESVQRCLSGRRGIGLAQDYRGVDAVVVYRWLAEQRMCLLSKQDTSEVLAPSRDLGSQLLLVGGLMLLLASALALSLAHTIVRPLRTMLAGVASFTDGERGVRLPVAGRDVVGRLSSEFNSMAAKIEHNEAELRQIAEGLEDTVEQRTYELAESETRTRLLLDSTAEAIYGVDDDGRCSFANRAFLEMLGYAGSDAVLGRYMASVLQGRSTSSPSADPLLEVHNVDAAIHFEDLMIRRADGSRMRVELSGYPMVRRGVRVGTMVTFLDITERRRATDELNQFFTLSLELLAIASLDGRFKRLNPAWERALGFTAEELIARPFDELVHPDDVAETNAQTARLGQGEQVVAFKNRYRCRDGSYRWLAWQAAPSPEDGLIYAAASDITIIMETEAALHRAKEAAESGSRAKSEFLANMSHEIRTPLNGVLGTLSLLLDSPLNRSQRELADLSRASGETLLTIINDILDFAKIEAGKLTLEHVPFDLLQTVEGASGMTGLLAANKGLDLVVRYPAEVPRHVLGDPGRIRQVLVNLINNAVKFTDRGHVLVDVMLQADHGDTALVRINVVDTGIGIAPEHQARLFEKFVQADASTTRRYGGTGLGLAISTQLIEMMNGSIAVSSVEGQGAAFSICLPLARQSGLPAEAPPLVDLRGTRCLIVDDNPTNRRVLHEQIIQWGLRNGSCVSAKEALLALRKAITDGDPYPIAVLDYQMPDMDGEMLGREIKNDPELRETQLVMLTSLGYTDAGPRLLAGGFAAYLVKPVRQSDLMNALTVAKSASLGQQLAILPAGSGAEVADGALPPIGHIRVLLVEDNATNRHIALLMLRSLGCSVEVANDGRAALERIDEASYDIIFMDCEMPVMDGFEATAAIRARADQKARIPIVAVTAQAMQGDRERCLAAGMDDYVSKPVETAAFRNMLLRWVEAAEVLPSVPVEALAPAQSGGGKDALDAQIVSRLRELAAGSEPGMLAAIFEAFRADSETRLAALRQAALDGNHGALRSAAHALKGSSASMGAVAMAETAAEVEALGLAGTTVGAHALLERLQLQYQQAQLQIDQMAVV